MSKLAALKDLATSKSARQILLARKHSPKILFIAGTVGVVGTVVLACRATLKLNEILEEDLERHAARDAANDDEYRKQLHKLQIKTGLEIAKLYAPAVIVGALSIGALTGSHVVLTKRNGAVMAAYAGLDQAYKQYRQRVSDEYGADIDHKFAMGSDRVLVEEKLADGTTKVVSKDVPNKNGKFGSPYAVLFDETCQKWSPEPGRNPMTISVNQSYANDKLRANGHLFLNEVYDMLGFPRTQAGSVVGWVYRHDNEERNGDNYVSFGVFDGDLERAESFVEGDEKSVWLDFNVDGVIYHLI